MEKFDITKVLEQEKDLGKVISFLQSGRLAKLPETEKYIKELNPKLHDVMDHTKRQDKQVNVDASSPDYGVTKHISVDIDLEGVNGKVKIVPVARIALAFQKLIVKRAAAMTFGNPVKYKASPENDSEELLYKAVMRVLKDNKEEPLNRKVARQVYGMTEVAELWYLTEASEPHTNYSPMGTPFKLRCVTFSPKYGDVLYPYFDNNHDMAAFSRRFVQKMSDGKNHTFFETYTADKFYKWQMDSTSSWIPEPGYPIDNPYKKIPIIYGYQEEPEYADVESIIKRLETMLSNFADTNDYHGSPKIVTKGHVNSFCQKGEAGAILELDPDASAEYLEWNHAPDSIRQEYETLKQLLHTITQTPDISWDAVKGTNVSGVALKLMFMDSVLKIKEKEEIWLDYLTRRVNLIKAMLAWIDVKEFNAPSKSLFIEPEIVPYIVIDEQERANIELSLTGNKQLKSRKTAMRDLGIDNLDEEIGAIEEEEGAANAIEQGGPTYV